MASAAVLLVACGDGEGSVRPALDEIAPAIAAVEQELGGPQQYFEINATPQLINLFVATDGATQVVRYVFVGNELGPAAATSAEGPTFAADAVTFDPSTILDPVTDELPGADVVLLAIAGGPGGAVEYRATVQSEEGGTFDVVLDPNG